MKSLLIVSLIVFYVLLIITVVFCERKRPTEAMLWVLVVTLLPYLGAIIYLIFGSTFGIRVVSYFRKKRLKLKPNTVKNNKIENASFADQQVIKFNTTYNDSEITSYDDFKFYIDGVSHYSMLFEDIRNAKECIFVEFYTIHNDEVGHAFVNELHNKALEGVRIIVLFDFIANVKSPNSMFKPLIDAGAEVIRIKPYLTHYRSHRKIVTIDHKISYIGGMNIGKQYANMAKVKNPWRDTQIRLVGGCTRILDEYFLTDYLCCVKKKNYDSAFNSVSRMFNHREKLNNNICQFVVGGVDNDKESIKMCYLSMIMNAKSKIRIQTPYFIPDASILDALKTAAATGVDIEIMIPGISASFFLDPVTNYYCGELLQYGAKIYKYNGYIHAKTMIIDNEICCVGSVNMDMRSLMVDDEVCGVFYANELVSDYNYIFNKDIDNCTTYTLKMYNNRTKLERVKEGLYLLFAPIM